MAKNKVKFEGALTQDVRKVINDNLADFSRCTTALAVTSSTTLADVTGMITDTLEAGTYEFEINLSTSATANGGVKAALKQGTASMLTTLVSDAIGVTASAVVAAAQSNTTDAASLIASTSAFVNVTIKGTIVIAVAGTLQLQAAQNASHVDTTTIKAGSYMRFTKRA